MIALDVDDVLAAFTPHAHEFHGVPMEKCNYWSERVMDARLGTHWFSKHIAHVEDFWRSIPRLSNPEDIDFEFHYYISSFPVEMYEIRKQWLLDNGFPDKPLVAASNKLEKCQELGVNVMIDDKPATIQGMIGTSVKGIHFVNEYAAFEPVGDYVVNNLNEVKKFL
jgi:hypothetical protein